MSTVSARSKQARVSALRLFTAVERKQGRGAAIAAVIAADRRRRPYRRAGNQARAIIAAAPSPQATSLRPAAERLIELVARRHGLGPKDVMSRSRVARIVFARHEAWYRLAAAGYSGPDVAALFDVDPSSVSDARNGFRVRHPQLAGEIDAVKASSVRVAEAA